VKSLRLGGKPVRLDALTVRLDAPTVRLGQLPGRLNDPAARLEAPAVCVRKPAVRLEAITGVAGGASRAVERARKESTADVIDSLLSACGSRNLLSSRLQSFQRLQPG